MILGRIALNLRFCPFTLIDSVRKDFSGTAGPENELIAIEFPFMKVGNQSSVGVNKF